MSRAWAAVVSLALGAAVIVTTEFIPVGFLPDVAADLHVSLGAAGAMVLVPGLSAALSAPLVIVAAGRLDRRALVVALGLLVIVSNALAALAPSFAVVLVARVFLGVAIGGFWGVVTPLGPRLAGPRGMAIVLAGLSAGTVIGLPAGQLFGNLIGWRWTFAATAGAAVAVVAVQLAVLPALPAAGRMRFGHLAGVLAVPLARLGLIVSGVVVVGQFAASTFVTPFLLRDAQMGSDLATVLFLGYGLAGIAGTLIGSSLVARSPIRTFMGAAAAFGALLIVLPEVSGSAPAVALIFAAWGLLWGFVPLALQTLMLTAMPEAPEAGAAMFITVSQLAIAVGSALGGVLVDSAGLNAVFVAGGIVAIAAAALAAIRTPRAAPRPSMAGESAGGVCAA